VPNAVKFNRELLEFTEILEPAFIVMPRVNLTVSLTGQLTRYAIKFEFDTVTPPTLTAILNESPVPSVSFKLEMTNEDMIAELLDGTVYNVVWTFADGFLCPSILYVLAICYFSFLHSAE